MLPVNIFSLCNHSIAPLNLRLSQIRALLLYFLFTALFQCLINPLAIPFLTCCGVAFTKMCENALVCWRFQCLLRDFVFHPAWSSLPDPVCFSIIRKHYSWFLRLKRWDVLLILKKCFLDINFAQLFFIVLSLQKVINQIIIKTFLNRLHRFDISK